MDTIEDPRQLREIYGAPNERSLKKELTRFDRHCRNFIGLSPFLVIASSDPSGRCDASPKGDMPGFVRVVDDTTLLIPDRLGNNRVDTLGNLLARPGVGLIFFVPGINETLRVNGRASVTTDPALLEPLAVNGKVPRSG
ncbi:MAG TPA: MSMEG_1061 family FMN-dependent PPOX-type flavoprotein, partial [Stellaceae bacterium]|nr:MSMEG_1061 family FMN-dependent PPOX-type flavoprotein [Stellaceae bacterium]